jgi:hypothetical protein
MLFFVPNFALPKGKNNSLEGALLETLSRKAASPQQSPSKLGSAFGSRAL